MNGNVGIGMAQKTAVVGDNDAPQNQPTSLDQTVGVITYSSSYHAKLKDTLAFSREKKLPDQDAGENRRKRNDH